MLEGYKDVQEYVRRTTGRAVSLSTLRKAKLRDPAENPLPMKFFLGRSMISVDDLNRWIDREQQKERRGTSAAK